MLINVHIFINMYNLYDMLIDDYTSNVIHMISLHVSTSVTQSSATR